MLPAKLNLESRRQNRGVISANNLSILRSPSFRPKFGAGFSGWYDVNDVSSMRNNAGSVPANSDGIKLLIDKSGVDPTNRLILNGVAGNWAQAPNTTAAITGDIDIRVYMSMITWTAASTYAIVAKYNAAGSRSYLFERGANGALRMSTSADGTAVVTGTSTANISASAYSNLWIRTTRTSATGDVNFYTSTDGIAWTQLGTTASTTAGAIFNSTALLGVGCRSDGTTGPLPANVNRVLIYSTIGSATNTGAIGSGSPSFDCDFTTFSKLATSGSAITGQTVTINTSGDIGAHISGIRDLYQGTAANQPVLTIASTGNLLTFDGTNDYMKSASFSFTQPTSFFLAGSQVTWSGGDNIFDGLTVNSGAVIQTSATPQINLNAGSSVAANTGWAVNIRAVINGIFNGASSLLRVNKGTATTGNAGAGNMLGLTLGATASPGAYGNITFSEGILYNTAISTQTANKIVNYLGRHCNINVN